MTHKKSVRPKENSDYSTVLILWQLDYYENVGVTRNQPIPNKMWMTYSTQ